MVKAANTSVTLICLHVSSNKNVTYIQLIALVPHELRIKVYLTCNQITTYSINNNNNNTWFDNDGPHLKLT